MYIWTLKSPLKMYKCHCILISSAFSRMAALADFKQNIKNMIDDLII